jgi:signal transduction histidine kinase
MIRKSTFISQSARTVGVLGIQVKLNIYASKSLFRFRPEQGRSQESWGWRISKKEGSEKKGMYDNMYHIPPSEWKIKLIPFSYRIAGLLLAAVFFLVFKDSLNLIVDIRIPVTIAILEFAIASLPPFLIPQCRLKLLGLVISSINTVLCILLLVLSGSIESPFIIYTLSPVLSAALYFNKKRTFIIGCVMGAGVVASYTLNPFYQFHISPVYIILIISYMVAIIVFSILPFETNINLRRRIEMEKIMEERHRLSRELHDGVAQTLHALCWQIQQVRRKMDATDGCDGDLEQLEQLAEKARADILLDLDILRNQETPKSLRAMLTDCLENFKDKNGIDYTLTVSTGHYNEENEVKKELVAICQEALANVKKHSGAHSVNVAISETHGFIELSIADDGKGFDTVSYCCRPSPSGHHGLEVMQERARLLNGKFKVMSLPEHGTELRIDVPLHRYKAKV